MNHYYHPGKAAPAAAMRRKKDAKSQIPESEARVRVAELQRRKYVER
jgi:hypothetical protein